VKINNYPIYKDLEPFKEYNFELILEIHESILSLLNVAISILNNKENELSIYKTKQNIGLNIDNFITTFNFNISVMREKLMMFINYIEFFHKMHSKYLKRFSNKIQLMYTHINHDIKFDDSIEVSKHKKKEFIDDFLSNHIDKDLLKNLKTSIGSETNSEDSNHSKNNSNSTTSISSLEGHDDKPLKKSSFKQTLKNNFHTVSSMLGIKPSKPSFKEINDVDKLFTDINQSCDLIINDTNEVLTIDYYNDTDAMLYKNFSNNDIIPFCDNDYREIIKSSSIDKTHTHLPAQEPNIIEEPHIQVKSKKK